MVLNDCLSDLTININRNVEKLLKKNKYIFNFNKLIPTLKTLQLIADSIEVENMMKTLGFIKEREAVEL